MSKCLQAQSPPPPPPHDYSNMEFSVYICHWGSNILYLSRQSLWDYIIFNYNYTTGSNVTIAVNPFWE